MCAPLDEAGWRRPTALPAWDVKDVVAHLASLDAMFLGREEPAHEPAGTSHVRNPLGHLNERMVDRRRGWSGRQVLDEFRETTGQRLDQLRASTRPSWPTRCRRRPGGMIRQGDSSASRLWDYVVHELDIAEALGLDLEAAVDTPAGRRVLDEMLMLLPRGVAKGGAPEGSAVALEILPPLARSAAARVAGGRGRPRRRGGGGGAAPSRLPRRVPAGRVGAPRPRRGDQQRRRGRGRRRGPGRADPGRGQRGPLKTDGPSSSGSASWPVRRRCRRPTERRAATGHCHDSSASATGRLLSTAVSLTR